MPFTPKIWLYRFLYVFARFYWKNFNPKNESAVCLVEYEGKILLARNTYGDRKWIFPGGGCQKNETPKESARREVWEEVGINLENLEDIGVYRGSVVNKNAVVYCFYGKTDDPQIQIDKAEIGDADWFNWENLPHPLSMDTAGIIEMYQSLNRDS